MFCSNCGNPIESTARFCPACGTARDVVNEVQPPLGSAFPRAGQLVRPRSPRVIAGVCAGFAEHYGWDLNTVRLVTVGVTLLTGVTLFVYLAAWIILPEGQYALPTPTPPPPAATPPESTAH